MKFATNAKRTLAAKGDGARVSTVVTRTRRAATSRRSVDEARQIEHVAQALAVRLEHDGKVRVTRGDREQVGRALSLRPERRSPRRDRGAAGAARAPAHSRKRAAKSAEPVEGARHHRLDGVGRGEKQLRGRRLFARRDAEGHPVVGVVDVGVDVLLAQPRGDGDGPRAR